MEDFAVLAKGFPPSATDPQLIQRWIEKKLGRTVVGISIGYNYWGMEAKIDGLLDDHLDRHEVKHARRLGVPGAAATHLPAGSSMTLEVPDASELDDPGMGPMRSRSADDVLQSLENSGEVFVVMRREEDCEDLFRIWEGQPASGSEVPRLGSLASLYGESIDMDLDVPFPPQLLPEVDGPELDFDGHKIQLRRVTSEPTSIVWNHLSLNHDMIRRRFILNIVVKLGIASFVLGSLLYTPLYLYVTRFAEKAGRIPSTQQTMLLGSMIGVGNTVISSSIAWLVPRVGFKRQDQADVAVFCIRAFVVFWNTAIVIVITLAKFARIAKPEHDILSSSNSALEVSELLGREAALAKALLTLFVSSTFVTPYLVFWLSYPAQLAQTKFLMKTGIFYGSKLTRRQGEKLLEPMEMYLPWDYAAHIQLPCCAFFPIFFSEPPGQCAARTLCAAMVVWCVVIYAAQRIIHLRYSKRTFFTTERLDKAALMLWAFPLSMLLHASVYWAVRAGGMEVENVTQAAMVFFLTFPANAIGIAVYIYFLKRVFRASSKVAPETTKTENLYNATLAELRYSYFNTNPVYVLMSESLPKSKNSDSNKRMSKTIWYEPGKVHLQAPDPKMEARLEAARAVAELGGEMGASPQAAGADTTPRRMFYQAQVWATGAPPHAYQSLNDH